MDETWGPSNVLLVDLRRPGPDNVANPVQIVISNAAADHRLMQVHETQSWSARLGAAREGSRDALGDLLESCRHYLLLVANEELNGQLRAKGGASDLVQDTFLEAQRDFGQFVGSSQAELRGWLRQILRHNMANFARSFCETEMRQVSREVAVDELAATENHGDLCTQSPSPGTRAIRNEQAELLHRALLRLPESYRDVVIRRSCERLTFEDVGQQIGRSADATRKLWVRAIERLRDELEGAL